MKSKDVDIYPIHNRVKFCLNALTCFYQPVSTRIIDKNLIHPTNMEKLKKNVVKTYFHKIYHAPSESD